jgi:hypothetical protein
VTRRPALVAAAVSVAATFLSSTSVEAQLANLSCQRVALSASEPAGMTGGTAGWWITLRSKGRKQCEVQGRPWVRVPPVSYPVVVDDLRVGDYGGGPGRALVLQPGRTLRARVLMSRLCDFRKSNAAILTVSIGWATQSVRIRNGACLDEGATVLVGPFQR